MTDEMTPDPIFDYPIDLDGRHRVTEGKVHDGDRYFCKLTGAYTHTGAWPTWGYCPYCGNEIDSELAEEAQKAARAERGTEVDV